MYRSCLCWAAALLSAVSISGCARRPPPPADSNAPAVQVSRPVVMEITDYEDFIGRTEAPAAVDVRARVSGYLIKGLRDESGPDKEGMEVKKGDLLFEIDPKPYEAEVMRAQGILLQTQEHVNRLERDRKRAEELLPTRAIPQEDYDKAIGDLAEAQATLAAAKGVSRLAELNLEFTKVLAPFDGRVSRQSVDPGNLVKADDTVLTSIVSLNPIYAYFDVDERTTMRVRRMLLKGEIKSSRQAPMPVMVGLIDEVDEKGNPLFPHEGFINFVDNRVDFASGTLRLRGEFPNPSNPNGPSRMFSPGMFVRVRIPIGRAHDAVLVAERALKLDQGQSFVYVVNDKPNEAGEVQPLVEYRPVKTGPLHNGLRVISEGLKPGERVVVNGLQLIRKTGTPVSPKEIPMPVQGVPPASPAGGNQTQVVERTPAS